MTKLADIADRIVQNAQTTSASANHLLVHRQLIGELREALKGHTFVTDEPTAARTCRCDSAKAEKCSGGDMMLICRCDCHQVNRPCSGDGNG